MENDFLAKAARMCAAIEAAMPRVRQMWDAFPYAELPGDDEAIMEMRQSARDWREYERSMMTAHSTDA